MNKKNSYDLTLVNLQFGLQYSSPRPGHIPENQGIHSSNYPEQGTSPSSHRANRST
jgi:hypothetical protein